MNLTGMASDSTCPSVTHNTPPASDRDSKEMASRRRVRAATVDLVAQDGVLVPLPGLMPTLERLAKGDVVGQRSLTPGILEQLALAGDLGENVQQLVQAAEWFMEQTELAQVRGRMVTSQLMTRLPV